MEAAWAIAAGAGLASLTGFRAIIPLAVYIFMARLGWVWGFPVNDNPMDFMISGAALVILLALVFLQVLMTRVQALAAVERNTRLPVAVAAAALIMSAALAGVYPGAAHFVGVPVGAALAFAGVYVHRGLIMIGEGRDPGPALDITVLFLSALMMLVPPTGYLLTLVIFYLAVRVRRLKRLKYKGLRVLA
jgi:hypothetical protein